MCVENMLRLCQGCVSRMSRGCVEGGRTKAGITPSSTILSMPFPWAAERLQSEAAHLACD